MPFVSPIGPLGHFPRRGKLFSPVRGEGNLIRQLR